MENNNTEKTHPFARTLGLGPYKVVGFMNISGDKQKVGGDSHLTRHPQWKGGCGTCQHCGLAIMVICVIRTGNGDLHGVGSACVLKANLPESERTIVERAVRARQAKNRKDLADKKRSAVLFAIENKAEDLKKIPHPGESFSSRGETYLEYCEFAYKGNWKRILNEIYKNLLSKNIIDKV